MLDALFQQMRFSILTQAINDTPAGNKLSCAYLYAWDDSVYPLLHEGATWHKPFEGCFRVNPEMIEELHLFFSDRWQSQNPITYYDLERCYGIHSTAVDGEIWDRFTLISACHYLCLYAYSSSEFCKDCRLYDNEFWKHLLSDCPSEAHSIADSFEVSDLYLL